MARNERRVGEARGGLFFISATRGGCGMVRDFAMRTSVKKTSQFREMLRSSRLEFLMEAHNGLSARIVEEAGFKGQYTNAFGSLDDMLAGRDYLIAQAREAGIG